MNEKQTRSLLRTDQLLLIENLTYLVDRQPFESILSCAGKSVEEIIYGVDFQQIEEDDTYGSFMTGADWKKMLHAISKQDILMHMQVLTSHIDYAEGGGGGVSAVFLSPQTGEAVVAFRGTAAMEWADDFVAGNMTDTPQQINALGWYQKVYQEYQLADYYVTLTGHSKGGNKVKYITLLDDSVDRCVAFDGQGFSDVFFEKYHDEILLRQNKIQNHNVDYDYVNILLNDIGEKYYYYGFEYGRGGFAESHCPNTFFHFGEDGEYTMELNPAGQSTELLQVDQYLNSYIRSMPKEKQSDILKVLGVLVERGFSRKLNTGEEKRFFDFFTEIVTDPEYSDDIAYMLAFTIKYSQTHTDFLRSMHKTMDDFGMKAIARYMEIAINILGNEHFDAIFGMVNLATGIIPGFALNRLLELLEKRYHVILTPKQAKGFFSIIPQAKRFLKKVQVSQDGADLKL